MGHCVHILTDSSLEQHESGAEIHLVPSLKGKESPIILQTLEKIKSDAVITTVTPLSLLSTAWYQRYTQSPLFAYLSYPFYSSSEILKALPHLTIHDQWQFGRHLFAPPSFWAKKLQSGFQGVICQSHNTANTIRNKIGSHPSVHVIPPGLDHDIWNTDKTKDISTLDATFLYLGSAKKIRGFEILLEAFSRHHFTKATLRILARGAAEQDLAYIQQRLVHWNIVDRVQVEGGWLSQEELKMEIQQATAVVLPFILVPSELPVSVMEVIACGTPAIVTNIDGLPETVGKGGLVIQQADVPSLQQAITCLAQDNQTVKELQTACHKQFEGLCSWNDVASLWKDALKKKGPLLAS